MELALAETDRAQFTVLHVERLSQALELAGETSFDAALLDLSLPDSHGLETLARFKEVYPAIPIIILSGQQEEEIAIAAVKAGAQDYLVKGLENSYLISRSILYSIERKRSQETLRQAHDELERRVDERMAELLEANQRLRLEIAERKQLEKALRKSEHQLRLITDALPVLISYVDKQQRYQFYNKAFDDWFGYSRDEVRGKYVKDTLDEKTYNKVQPYIESALSGTTVSIEIDVQHPRGDPRCIDVLFMPDKDDRGETRGFFALTWDITSRKQTEEQEKQRMLQLAHASRLSTTGQMATEIAHEINQPLTAIASYSDTCLRMLEADKWEKDDFMGALKQISNQAERAGDVVRQLRSFVRKHDSHRSTVNINDIVQEMVQLIEVEARWHQVVVKLRLADKPPVILANKVLVQQVLINFARNAIDAMAGVNDGPHQLTITTTVNGEDAIEVAVHDTGPGLPANNADQVFEAFYTTKDDGVGMGLSISESIIKAHQGRIWARNNDTGGCTFAFALPIMTGDRNLDAT